MAAKSSYEQSLVHNYAITKDSKIFHCIKEFTGQLSLSLPPQDSTTAVSASGKANHFNQSFTLFLHIVTLVMSNLPIPSNHLDSICITEQKVLDALSCLNSNKAGGIDKIPPIILKHCASALFLPIHYLFKFKQ